VREKTKASGLEHGECFWPLWEKRDTGLEAAGKKKRPPAGQSPHAVKPNPAIDEIGTDAAVGGNRRTNDLNTETKKLS
jgi:hypothetical protein